jgi:hypothetical protein
MMTAEKTNPEAAGQSQSGYDRAGFSQFCKLDSGFPTVGWTVAVGFDCSLSWFLDEFRGDFLMVRSH